MVVLMTTVFCFFCKASEIQPSGGYNWAWWEFRGSHSCLGLGPQPYLHHNGLVCSCLFCFTLDPLLLQWLSGQEQFAILKELNECLQHLTCREPCNVTDKAPCPPPGGAATTRTCSGLQSGDLLLKASLCYLGLDQSKRDCPWPLRLGCAIQFLYQ